MQLLADENIPAPLVAMLREHDHDVLYVAELDPGLTDDEVLALGATEGRPILTEDRDFGEMVFRQRKSSAGIILLRLPTADRSHWQRVAGLLLQFESKLASGVYVVIDSDRIRMRPLPGGSAM